MKALLIREMLPSETSLVLSDWKKDLWENQKANRPEWGRALQTDEWWALVNHVIDSITLPSSKVYVACHRDEEKVPLAWCAQREGQVLHTSATFSVQRDVELAARLERALLSHAQGDIVAFNPFSELKRS